LFNASLKKTLVLTYTLIALIPMIIVSVMFYRSAATDIEGHVFDQLTAVNSIKKKAIEDYFQQIADQVTLQSDNLMLKSALAELTSSFHMANIQLAASGTDTSTMRRAVEAYYEEQFAAEYQSRNDQPYGDALELTASMDEVGIAMQYEYIAANSHALGEKHLLTNSGSDTDYDSAHGKYHPWLRSYLEKFGYYDIFLIDMDGYIVYSVYKELDYATSLLDGPYSNSNLAAVYNSAVSLSDTESVAFEDFQQYLPSYDAPASFVASPIIENGQTIGVLAFQMPLDRINSLMGQREGMGETGESYLVGPDKLMRSDSYLDPEFHSVINSIRFPDTGLVDTQASQQALAGNSGTEVITDYNGNAVLSSYAPLSIFGTDWAIIAELDEAEALAAVDSLRTTAMMMGAGVSLIVAVLAYFLASSLANPVIKIARSLQQIAEGSLDVDIQSNRKDEIGQLAKAMQAMQAKLKLLIDDGIRPIVSKASRGQLDDRLRLEDAQGFYKELVTSMNSLLDVNEKFLNDTARVVGAMAQGNLTTQAENAFEGRFAQVQEDVESMRSTLHEIITVDVQRIVSAARQGDLGKRIAMTGKQGCFEELAQDINALVDVNDNIIADVSNVTSALSEGRLDVKIDRQYAGRFADLIDNVTSMQRKLEEVIEKDIQQIVAAAVDGDLRQRIDLDGKQGFYAALSESINELVSTSDQIVTDSSEVMSAMAQGDLTKTISTSYKGTFEKLKTDINSTVDKLTEIVRDIQESAAAVKTGSSEISKGSIDLSSRTEEQAASLEETSASLEELTSTVRESSDNSTIASQLSAQSSDVANRGGTVVSNAVVAMDAILHSSETIANFVNVIDEIAFQTNLLALNASVEAARAGEQGKGFAVVAEEVRVLASRSAESAREIKLQIEDSRLKVNEGSELVNESGQMLAEIISSVDKVNNIVSEISTACEQQSKGLDEINSAVTQMDDATQQNAALVEESAAASESLSDQANRLDSLVSYFRIDHSRSSNDKVRRVHLRVAN
jgi:methyl-accepting chemotaxis protein